MADHVCDGVDKVSPVEARGDYGHLFAIALRARESDATCTCAEPILAGSALMCRCCLREHDGQRADLARRMSQPHAFVEGEHSGIGMCGLCTFWRDDLRHVKEAVDANA